jgi:hypothetical protein
LLFCNQFFGVRTTILDGVSHAFLMAGKVNSALTALAYLKEAVAAGQPSPVQLAHVRKFVSRCEHQPHLAFLPPRPSL